MAKRKNECQKYGCDDEVYRIGYCKNHYEERQKEKSLYDKAVDALHTGTIDNKLPENGDLKEELMRLMRLWQRVCAHLNSGLYQNEFGGNGELAKDICISLAKVIVDEELRHRHPEYEGMEKAVARSRKSRHWEDLDNLVEG